MLTVQLSEAITRIVGETNVITDPEKVEKLSKDFYWYSPILKRQLADKKADLVAKPDDLESLKQLVALCVNAGVPITLRGGGTGNYGQQIPLHGGVLLDLSGLDRIYTLDGVVRAEPGAKLGTIEPKARELGWELRCLPSTWVKSSLGGFLCGGSGGIGSITWGGINNADNVKSVTLLTIEAEPQLVRYEERDAIKALHTYGTTGIMVEIEMRLAPKRDYDQLALAHADWDKLIDWTDAIARDSSIGKRLVTQFEKVIPPYFKPLKKYLPEDQHITFLLIERAHADRVRESATQAGIDVVFDKPLPDPLKPPYLTDYTWNHTTLWALKSNPTVTYLQNGFQDNFREQIKQLWARFPGEIAMHLEWVAGNTKMEDPHRGSAPGAIVVGGLPVIFYKSEERLREIIDYLPEIGVSLANPHTYKLEEGGRHPNIEEKRQLKARMDPKGILNPGKMATYAHNPFACAS